MNPTISFIDILLLESLDIVSDKALPLLRALLNWPA